MQVFKNELTCSIDVDDTLVMWEGNIYKPGKGKIGIFDPNGAEGDNMRYLVPHQRHIKFLKKLANRGYQITVWSAGGWAWAESVVNTLGLNQYVAKVESKPLKIIDDLPTQEGIGQSFFLSPLKGEGDPE